MNIETANVRFAEAEPEEIVRWAIDTFGNGLILSSSFGAESALMLHMATRLEPNIKVVVVDTGYFFEETYTFMEQLRERFSLNLITYASLISPEEMEHEDGKLWERDMSVYNHQRKTEPMERALRELRVTGWLTGRRAYQASERARLSLVERVGGLFTINPIVWWTKERIATYMSQHQLPYHPLVEQGYASIGDWHSTKPGQGRGGRFVGQEKKVCGLHRGERPKA